jgi:hypothetical protein
MAIRTARPKHAGTRHMSDRDKDHIRVKLGEAAHYFTFDELVLMLHEVAGHLELAGLKGFHFHHCSLYLSPALPALPFKDKFHPVTAANGLPLKDILIPEPYRSGADDHGL